MPQVLVLDEQAVHQYKAAAVARQQEARYPQLMLAPWIAQEGVIYSHRRAGSGLVALALEHHTLTPAQHQALGEFRLQQYLLCGWYDSRQVAQLHLQTDPLLDQAPATTIHVLVGTPDGRLLAYFSMQEALPGANDSGQFFLTDVARPLFSSESELFSPELFPSLPALRDIPMAEIRELSCLLRNQTMVSALSVIAVVEAIYTMTRLVMRPHSSIRALLGGVGLEARQMTASLGIPILYAPLAPVIRAPELEEYDSLWAEGEQAPGKFWPFVIAVDDLRAREDHFRRLDGALSGSEQEIRRALSKFRKQRQALAPRAFVPAFGTAPLLWTADLKAHPSSRQTALAAKKAGQSVKGAD